MKSIAITQSYIKNLVFLKLKRSYKLEMLYNAQLTICRSSEAEI